MSAEAELIAMLNASAPVTALLSGRVFLNAADEQTPMPYVVVTASHDPELLIDGSVDRDHITFTIAAWGASAHQAEGVLDAVALVLNADDDYAILNRTGGFDEQTGDDAAVMTADRWV